MPTFDSMAHLLMLTSEKAASALIAAVWEGLVLAVGVALCLHFMKGITAAVRSGLWTSVLVLAVLLHLAPLLGSSPAAPAAPGRVLHADHHWSLAIVCLWVMLSLWRGAQLVHSAMIMRSIGRRATPFVPSASCAALLRTRFRSAELCTSKDVDRPSVIGFFRPRILIPSALLDTLPFPDLEQIVLHEMEHLRRADDWTNLVQKLSLVLFPLNPVLFWIERRLCLERELACDDRVLDCTHARKAYATCLVNLAEGSVLRRRLSLALGAWERESELGRRVRRILFQPRRVMGRRRMALVSGAVALAALGGTAILAREPQLVSFVPAPSPAPFLEATIATQSEVGSGMASRLTPISAMRSSASIVQSKAATAFPRMIDTVFRQPAASMPAVAPRLQGHKPRAAAARVRTANQPAAVSVPRRSASQSEERRAGSLVMLTRWSGSTPPQVRLLVSPLIQQTYAAIQMENGWLIVQL